MVGTGLYRNDHVHAERLMGKHLTVQQVTEIGRRLAAGETIVSIARAMDIPKSTVGSRAIKLAGHAEYRQAPCEDIDSDLVNTILNLQARGFSYTIISKKLKIPKARVVHIAYTNGVTDPKLQETLTARVTNKSTLKEDLEWLRKNRDPTELSRSSGYVPSMSSLEM